jgi:peptide/nickel transport system permease protein
MRAYAKYLAARFGQFLLVVFIGINLAYVITHATPIDPVEHTVSVATSFGQTAPEAVAAMRQSLRELYGLTGSPLEQYVTFWRRVLVGDFGPSLSAFPTPVVNLIARAAPWTIGLLGVSTLLTWAIGNLLGGLAGYYRRNRTLKAVGILAMALHPMPHYIAAIILLLLFGFVWPIFPISGGSQMNVPQGFNADYMFSVLKHAVLPTVTLVLVGLGGWFLGMRSLVSNIVTEDYVIYAEIAGVPRRRILSAYVMRSALAPQVTGLAISLGHIFSGALIIERVFSYPGIGSLLVDAVHAADYSLVLGVSTVSILGVAIAVFVIDMIYPLIDPRVTAR